MRQGNSFFYLSQGPDATAIDAGLGWLTRHPASQKVIVFSSVQNGKDISCSYHAKQFLDLLYKERRTTINKQEYIFATPKTIPHYFAGAALLIQLTSDSLDSVDAELGKCDAFYIPWQKNEHLGWASRWGATDFVTGQNTPLSQVSSPALEKIAESPAAPNINHDLDHDSVLNTLERLHHQGKLPFPDDIAEFLMRKSWMPKEEK